MIYISKHNFLRFIYFSMICIIISSCDSDDDPVVMGCIDDMALNYNSNATESDPNNPCEYPPLLGCMDDSAINYNVNAEVACGDCCEYSPGVGCMDTDAENYDLDAIEPCDDCCEFKLDILFTHFINQDEIVFGNTYYVMGLNTYSVRRILYVLSDITLYFDNNDIVWLDDFIFVNTDDSITLTHTINNLPAACTGISFRLGFSTQDNIDNAYLDSPNQFHNNMVWPNSNGTNLAFQGGYHYMKLEGGYNAYEYPYPFQHYNYNTHTGPTNATDFSILYPPFYFSSTSSIIIKMNVDNWYNKPQYIISDFGNGIMSNSTAQDILQQNGLDVFSVE